MGGGYVKRLLVRGDSCRYSRQAECADGRGAPADTSAASPSLPPPIPHPSTHLTSHLASPHPAAQVGQAVWGVGNPNGLDHTLTQVCVRGRGGGWPIFLPSMELATKYCTYLTLIYSVTLGHQLTSVLRSLFFFPLTSSPLLRFSYPPLLLPHLPWHPYQPSPPLFPARRAL